MVQHQQVKSCEHGIQLVLLPAAPLHPFLGDGPGISRVGTRAMAEAHHLGSALLKLPAEGLAQRTTGPGDADALSLPGRFG